VRRQDVLWTLAAVALLAILVVLLVLLWFWHNQERVTFQPERGPFPEPPSYARRIDYQAADGQPLFAYVVGDSDATRTVIAFHGNADLAVRQLAWAAELARRTGCRVMVVEYRGYAGLPGRPTYDGSRLDAAAAWTAAERVLGARPDETVLFGHSLGSAIAAELATELQVRGGPRALVLQSPLQSARAMARVIAGPVMEAAWGALSRVHYDTEARVKRLDTPVWVAHGERDFVIPSRMGRALFAAARVPGRLLLVPTAGHNDVAESGGEAYWHWLDDAVVR
jgi:pimeloyl-ACP methyl ester carboxylesterase